MKGTPREGTGDGRLVLAPDAPSGAPGAIARAGVDPTLEGRALPDALHRAIATRRGYCSWTGSHASWVVTRHSPEEQDFSGKTVEEGIGWYPVWLMAKGTPREGTALGIGPFLV